jgi:hypothetical protein
MSGRPQRAFRAAHVFRFRANHGTLGGIIGASGIAIVASMAALAPAQAQFTGVYGFGDSYADTGAAPGGAFRIAGVGFCIANPAACRFTGGTAFVESLQAIYGLPTMTNYAIGGARTGNTNTLTGQANPLGPPNPLPVLPGFPYELQQLSLSGTRFSNTDLIAISIGGMICRPRRAPKPSLRSRETRPHRRSGPCSAMRPPASPTAAYRR